MIYTVDLINLGLSKIAQYYNVIFSTYQNESKEEAESVYKMLSVKQRLDFLDWVEINHPEESEDIKNDFESILENNDAFNELKDN